MKPLSVATNERASAGDLPKIRVRETLFRRSSDVLHVMAEFPQAVHSHAWDVLISQDLHSEVLPI